jgi:hypothetical protein
LPKTPGVVLRLVRALDDYIKWLHDCGYGDKLPAGYEVWSAGKDHLFPGADVVRMLYAAHYARKFSLLAHVKKRNQTRPQPPSAGLLERDDRRVGTDDTKRFPIKYLVPLLAQAFVKCPVATDPLDREDVTGHLAAVLLAGGGIRESEPHHLWVNDITIVDGEPVVFLRHPQLSLIDLPDGSSITREEYLGKFCAMLPRNRMADKFHSGWKGIKLGSEHWAMMYWLPLPGLKEHFLAAYLEYIRQVRPKLMQARRSRGLPDHPFLLVSSGRAQQEGDNTSVGDPYTRVAARNSWSRAFNRLQHLYPDANLVLAKSNGTTRHGLRHLYGGTLAELGVSSEMVQECMHHISPRSQLVYKEPLKSAVHLTLSEAAENIRRGNHPLAAFRFQTTDEALRNPLHHEVP